MRWTLWVALLALASPAMAVAHENDANETEAGVTVREDPGGGDAGGAGGDDGPGDGTRTAAVFLLILAAVVGLAFVAVQAWRRR